MGSGPSPRPVWLTWGRSVATHLDLRDLLISTEKPQAPLAGQMYFDQTQGEVLMATGDGQLKWVSPTVSAPAPEKPKACRYCGGFGREVKMVGHTLHDLNRCTGCWASLPPLVEPTLDDDPPLRRCGGMQKTA